MTLLLDAGTAAAEQLTTSIVASTASRIASQPTGTSSLASSLTITDHHSASFVLVCSNAEIITNIVRLLVVYIIVTEIFEIR